MKPARGHPAGKVMPGGSNATRPTNTGVAYPITPEGYYNQTEAFTPWMKKYKTEPPTVAPRFWPATFEREGRLWNPFSEDSDRYYGTQKTIVDMRYSPSDIAAREDPEAYQNVDGYMKPEVKVRKRFLREATARIPRAVIVQERPATNLFQNDDPAQVRLGQLANDPVYKGRQTVKGEIPESDDKKSVARITGNIRQAVGVYKKNALLFMIKQGNDYDQGTYPWGLSGAFPHGGDPGTVAPAAGRQIEAQRPMDIGAALATAAKSGAVHQLVTNKPLPKPAG